MFYTIIAAVIFIVSGYLLAYNLLVSQNINVGNFFDRQYLRNSNNIAAEIDEVSIVGKRQYLVTFAISNAKSVDIEVSEERLKRLQKCDEIYLMEFSIPKGKIYCISPISEIGFSGIKKVRLHSFGGDEAEELDRKARFFQKIGIALLALAFFTCPSTPLTSIVLSVLSGIISVSVVPLLPWTRAKGFGIIKAESQKSKDKTADSKVPVGYSDWSDTNKELFSIEQRVLSQIQESSESQVEPNSNVKAESKQETDIRAERQEENISVPQSQTDSIHTNSPARFCKYCNHPVRDEAIYCEMCGHKLVEEEKSISEESRNHRVEPEAKQENILVQETVPSSPIDEKEKDDTTQNTDHAVHLGESKDEPKQQSNYKQRRRRRKPAASNDIADMINDIANQE